MSADTNLKSRRQCAVPTRTIVGISELAVSTVGSGTLVTHSLGSCMGVSIHDPVAHVGGMLHAMMPLSAADPERARTKPGMYVDSGMTTLLERMFALGATKRNLVIRVAGGASNMDSDSVFRIGERNYTVLRKILWKNALFIQSEDVGGSKSRTMTLDLATGETTIKSNGVMRPL